MKKYTIVLLVVFVVFSELVFPQTKSRSMWVWGSTTGIIEYSTQRQNFYDFCSNPPGMNSPNAVPGFPRNINRVFMSAHRYVVGDSSQRAKLHSFLKDAHSHNLIVEYLDGNKTWATTNISAGESYIDSYFKFNSEVSDPSERFDGVQYDVEPYLNSGWGDPSTRQQIWDGFIELLTYCQTKIDSLNDGSYFGVAIPRWYDSQTGWPNNKSGIYYMHQLLDLVDYVAIMDYVDTSSRIIKDAGAEVLYADQIGKRVVIGVETQSVTPSTSTFYEEGWGNMEPNLFEVDQYFKDHSGYDGIAIHHYDYYNHFPQWGTNDKDVTPPELIDSKFFQKVSGNYFRFHIVDICGTGLNEDATIANSHASIDGNWQVDSTNYISFYPTGQLEDGTNYSFTINAVDSSGNLRGISKNIKVTITSVNEQQGSIIKKIKLLQNYPNPFNPTTNIRFDISKAGFTTLKIYNILGKRVETLVNSYLNPGSYNINFNGSNLASGMYIYSLTSGEKNLRKKMILLK